MYLRMSLLVSALLTMTLSACSSSYSESSNQADNWMKLASEGHISSVHQYADEINVLQSNGQFPLEIAYQLKDRLAFATLLEVGADPNITLTSGDTLLCQAAANVDPFYLRELLSHEVQLAQRESRNTTRPNASFCAAEAGRIRNVRLLVEAGIDDTTTNGNGQTVWDIASKSDPVTVQHLRKM